MKKTLHLTIKKKWFDEILHGEKKVEYREIKRHWTVRLLDERGMFVEFDEVEFKNGYLPDSLKVVVECKGIDVGYCPIWDKDSYRIHLGEIIRTGEQK